MTDRQRRLLGADARFQAFLQQPSPTVEPDSSVAGESTTSLPHFTHTRSAEVEAAINEALDRQNNTGSSTPTIRGTVYDPEAQQFHPSSQHSGQGGAGGSQGTTFNPEAEEFHPSGQQGSQPGERERGPGH